MKTLEADVIVVSAGTAGLAAAVTAAEGGARVIVFEKLAHTGGTGNVGSMVIGAGSSVQKRAGINITPIELFKLHMDYVHWRADARLVKAFYEHTGVTIDWLEKLGVEFRDMTPGASPMRMQYPVTHGIIGGSYSMMKILANRARELGTQIFLRTPVRKIIKEGNRITGVIAVDSERNEIRANARAVIVAAGGFGSNVDWIKKYTGFDWGKDIFSFKMPGTTGDGISMAWEVGAARSEMIMQLIFSLPIPYHGAAGTSSEFMIFTQPGLMVNLMGERFVNEDALRNTTYGGNAIARQPGCVGFMIIDEDTKKHFEKEGFGFPFGPPPGGGRSPGGAAAMRSAMPKDLEAFLKETHLNFVFEQKASDKEGDLAASISAARAKGFKHLFMADSLDELCAQTGIDLPGLQKTVTEYNRACEQGYDAIFEKDPKNLRPVKTPKFYAAGFYPSAYGTLGGIKINYKTEVLDNDSRVIPGLYAAGTDAAAIYGDSYTRHLGGNTQGFCINSGRMAGESALEYLKIHHL